MRKPKSAAGPSRTNTEPPLPPSGYPGSKAYRPSGKKLPAVAKTDSAPAPKASPASGESRTPRRAPPEERRVPRDATRRRREGNRARLAKNPLGPGALAAGAALLVLPGLAVYRLSSVLDVRYVAGAFLLVSAVTWYLYSADKRRAQSGKWRTPESTLHLAELAGGWPVAFFAQRILRHKIVKVPYQVTYWLIVIVHQYAAWDCLRGWALSRGLVDFVRGYF